MRLGDVAVPIGTPHRMRLLRVSTRTQSVCPAAQLICVPQRLNFLRDFDRLAAIENVHPGAPGDHGPVLARVHAGDRRRADRARHFVDRPGSGLVHAVVFGDVERAVLHEVEALAQQERRAHGLPVVFGNAHESADAVVAFGIFGERRAHQRSVVRLGRGKNLDVVDQKSRIERGRAVGVDAQQQVGRNRREAEHAE